MHARACIPVDKTAFFAFVKSQAEGRFEFDRGPIMQQMSGVTRRHVTVAQRFVSEIERQLPRDRWLVSSHGRGVETDVTARQCDTVVEPVRDTWEELAATEPALLVEVISPSSRDLDLDVKPAECTSLASLVAYIVAEQDEARCRVWMRDAAGVFPAQPEELVGFDAVIQVATLGVSIRPGDIYSGIVFK